VARLQVSYGGGQERFKPRQKNAVGAVADPEPKHLRCCLRAQGAFGKILVFGDHNPCACQGEVPDRGVFSFAEANVPGSFGFVAARFEEASEGGRKLRINEETHLAAYNNGMIKITRSVCEAGSNIGGFKVRVVLENLLFRHAIGQHIEHVFYPDAHAPNAGASAALIWIDSNPLKAGLIIRAVGHV